METWMILDGILAVIAVLFTVIGGVRGFIKTAVRLIGALASALIATFAAQPLAVWLYDAVFHTQVEQFVTVQVQNGVAAAAQSLNEQIDAVTGTLPQGLQSLFLLLDTEAAIQSGAAQSAEQLIATVMEQVAAPLCTAALQVIVFVVLFAVLFILIHVLGICLDKTFSSMESTKKANHLFGGVLGFLESIPLILVLTVAVQLYMTFAGAHSVITVQDIENTYLMEWLMQVNPLL